MLITGTSQVNVNIQGYYDKNLLDRAYPALIHGRFAQSRPLPKNAGTRINFRRMNGLPANTTPLGEGVTPDGKMPTVTDIYAVVKQYGDLIIYSDLLSMTTLDATLIEFGEILADQMGLSKDTLDRDRLVAGTSVRRAAGVSARTSIATAITVADLKAAVRILEGSNARKISKMIVAGERVATRPVPPSYYAIVHTDSRQDLEAINGFIKVEEYARPSTFEEEIGNWGSVRFLATSNAKIWTDAGALTGSTNLVSSGTKVDVYGTVIMADNAYGSIPLQAGNVKNIIKALGSGGVEDGLDQRGSTGWKIAESGKILDDDMMIRIEHGVTDL